MVVKCVTVIILLLFMLTGYYNNGIISKQEEIITKQEEVINEQLEIIKCLELANEKQEEEFNVLLSRRPIWKPVDVELSYYTAADDEGSGTGLTASGTKATVGRTVASNVYPFGTKLMIDGKIFVVEDRGSSIVDNCIDVLVGSKEEAYKKGRHQATIYILEGE